MRNNWFKLLFTIAFFASFLGCRTPKPNVKPNPPLPEDYKLPPNENRYANPTTYPKELLDMPTLKKKDAGPGGGPGAGFGP
jgi:hypothetical protein